MALTALLSLVAGLLTVLAPCVLPFLPVIVGGSLSGQRRRPYVVAAALVGSLLVFTLALKATTVLLDVDPRVWTTASGGLVVALGLSMLFPGVWAWFSTRAGLDRGSHHLLDRATNGSSGTTSAVLTGVALGPVFSSCSPTYAYVVAAVLPVSPLLGMVYLSLYCVGVAAALLAISLAGRRLVTRLRWAANPRGWFQRVVAVLFIVVGLAVMTGVDKKVETWATSWVPSLSAVEQAFVPDEVPGGGEESSGADDEADGLRSVDESPIAPELTGITDWVGSQPLTLESLRGKVVLVDFWTYSCINCIRTQPYLNAWYETYHDQGLEIIGVHAPEFAFEKVRSNVEQAVKDAGIAYPVALDNDFATWRAYSNRYWPAKYLIDAEGRVRYFHAGEGDYERTEEAIRTLLGSTGSHAEAGDQDGSDADRSPETYLGTDRASGYVGEVPLAAGTHDFTAAADLDVDEWTLDGAWQVDGQSVGAAADGASLTYRFRGREMYLVLAGPAGARVEVMVDGERASGGEDVVDGSVVLDSQRLYRLVRLPDGQDEATVTLTFSQGVSAHAFTFG